MHISIFAASIPFIFDMKKILWALDKALITYGFIDINFRFGIPVVN